MLVVYYVVCIVICSCVVVCYVLCVDRVVLYGVCRVMAYSCRSGVVVCRELCWIWRVRCVVE